MLLLLQLLLLPILQTALCQLQAKCVLLCAAVSAAVCVVCPFSRVLTHNRRWCVQEAGDIVSVPHDWWHCVLNLEPGVCYTQNYINASVAAGSGKDVRSPHPRSHAHRTAQAHSHIPIFIGLFLS